MTWKEKNFEKIELKRKKTEKKEKSLKKEKILKKENIELKRKN